MPFRRAVLVLASLAAAPALTAQTLQYRSPAGVSYYAQPDTGAVARAESTLAADPRSVPKLIALGIAQSGIRRFREAITTFTRGMAIDSGNAVLYRWRGHRYLSTRQLDLALRDFARGNALDSNVYGIWYHLGIVHFIRGEFDAGGAQLCPRPAPGARRQRIHGVQ